MRGDFAMFITHNKKTNNYYLEMYRFEVHRESMDRLKIFQSKNQVSIKVAWTRDRKYVAFLVEVSDH